VGAHAADPQQGGASSSRRGDNSSSSSSSGSGPVDLNHLQTQLSIAVDAEDYALAAQLKQQIAAAVCGGGGETAPHFRGWAELGIPPWLVDRVERLGFRFPNAIQQEAAKQLMLGADVVISSETGSGKTLAFLLPALALLSYPPNLCAPLRWMCRAAWFHRSGVLGRRCVAARHT
jgi:DEAD/DEAH box helicase